MTRVFNFGAGPATLPEDVLRQAQEEFLDWQSSGMSVVEVSHRSQAFEDLLSQAEADLRALLDIPNNYHVLFLSGPARAQFAMVPMNLLRGKSSADYIDSGIWSHIAITEAQRYCKVNVAASMQDSQYQTVLPRQAWQVNSDAAYLYYTANETINGVEFHEAPDSGSVPLVTDMTATLLSRPIDVSQFGLIFAGSQKNIAPAGLTVVIVREDLVGETMVNTPTVFDYKVQQDNKSLYYTPTSFSCYFAGLMFRWLKDQGGLAAMGERNQRKAAKLYRFIDESDYYSNPIDPDYRSWMNVPFILAEPDRDQQFLESANEAGLVALKGHRLVGGMRASLYNAMPEAGVDALIEFMKAFEKNHG